MSTEIRQIEADLAEVEQSLQKTKQQATEVPIEEASQIGGLLAVLQAKAGALRSRLAEARARDAEKQAIAAQRKAEREHRAKIKALESDVAKLQQAWQEWQDRYMTISDEVEALWSEFPSLQSRSKELHGQVRDMGLDLTAGLVLRSDVAERRRRGRAAITWAGRRW